jgi:ribosomal protein S18 acetylase RimI-like enzyme
MRRSPPNAAVNPTAAKKTPPFLLRPAAPPDDAFLLRLYATVRAAELASTDWDATQRGAFIRSQYLARKADYTARFPGAEQAIVTLHGRDAGVWTVWRTKAEFRLINVELLPEYRAQGVGSALLRGLLAEAKTSRLPVRLSVREDNLAAQRLYRRLGFHIEGHRNGYLAMGNMP